RVRRARVARALGRDVDALPTRDELGAREGAEQVCQGHEQGDDDSVSHRRPFFATAGADAPWGTTSARVAGVRSVCCAGPGMPRFAIGLALERPECQNPREPRMPTYVYECAKCGDEFEHWQSFSDDPLKKHPECGGKVTKVLQPVGIVFKGSGFH